MWDFDLAELYNAETKCINEQVAFLPLQNMELQ